MNTDEMKLLTPNEVADLLKVHIKTVYKWVERGLLPAHRIPSAGEEESEAHRRLRFKEEDVLNMLEEEISDHVRGSDKKGGAPPVDES